MPERLVEIPEEYPRKMDNIFRLQPANQENGSYNFLLIFPIPYIKVKRSEATNRFVKVERHISLEYSDRDILDPLLR